MDKQKRNNNNNNNYSKKIKIRVLKNINLGAFKVFLDFKITRQQNLIFFFVCEECRSVALVLYIMMKIMSECIQQRNM